MSSHEILHKINIIENDHKKYIKERFFNPMMTSNDMYALEEQYEILCNFYKRIKYVIKTSCD